MNEPKSLNHGPSGTRGEWRRHSSSAKRSSILMRRSFGRSSGALLPDQILLPDQRDAAGVPPADPATGFPASAAKSEAREFIAQPCGLLRIGRFLKGISEGKKLLAPLLPGRNSVADQIGQRQILTNPPRLGNPIDFIGEIARKTYAAANRSLGRSWESRHIDAGTALHQTAPNPHARQCGRGPLRLPVRRKDVEFVTLRGFPVADEDQLFPIW